MCLNENAGKKAFCVIGQNREGNVRNGARRRTSSMLLQGVEVDR